MEILLEKSAYHTFALYYKYDPRVVDFCRALKTEHGWEKFSWDSALGRWVFTDVKFIEIIKRSYPDVEIEPEAEFEYNKVYMLRTASRSRQEKIDAVKEKTDSDIKIKGIKGELYGYQKVGVEFLLASGGRALIADPPGVGKTLQSLAYVAHKNLTRTLVIAPASVKSSWKKEIEKWTDLPYFIIDSKTKLKDIPKDTKIWVINYELLKKNLPFLLKTHFNLMIADECHLVKSPKAQRTKAIMALATKIKEIILLSGTPLLSRPIEMYTLLHMIDPETWDNWYTYSRSYCNGHQDRFGYNVSGSSNAEELHHRIKRYFIRRKKEDVLTELPPKVRDNRQVDLSPKYKTEYNEAENDLAQYLYEHKGKRGDELASTMAAEQLARLNILRQLAALGKTEAAKDIIDSILESGEKVIVFSSFMEPLKELQEKYKDKTVTITGTTPVGQRGDIVDDFQINPKKQIFLGGIKSAGVGITLTAASNVLFLDYAWNPSDMIQAEDRIHRPGQEAQSANIYQLHAKGTIDERLLEILEIKQDLVDRIIDGEDVTKEELSDVTNKIKGASKAVIGDIMSRHEEKKETSVSEFEELFGK